MKNQNVNICNNKVESGTGLRYTVKLPGHKGSKTTGIYIHVTEKSLQKIKSPFDD